MKIANKRETKKRLQRDQRTIAIISRTSKRQTSMQALNLFICCPFKLLSWKCIDDDFVIFNSTWLAKQSLRPFFGRWMWFHHEMSKSIWSIVVCTRKFIQLRCAIKVYHDTLVWSTHYLSLPQCSSCSSYNI